MMPIQRLVAVIVLVFVFGGMIVLALRKVKEYWEDTGGGPRAAHPATTPAAVTAARPSEPILAGPSGRDNESRYCPKTGAKACTGTLEKDRHYGYTKRDESSWFSARSRRRGGPGGGRTQPRFG